MGLNWSRKVGAAVLALLVLAAFPSGSAMAAGGFEPLSTGLYGGRYDPMSVGLPDGRILVIGGISQQTKSPPWPSDSVDSFDPVSQEFTHLGSLPIPMFGADPVALDDGRVLLVGGEGWFQSSSVVVLDPDTGQSQIVSVDEELPEEVSAASLPDGKVLVFGGFDLIYGIEDEQLHSTGRTEAWIFNPETGEMRSIEDLPQTMRGARTFPLSDGRLLILASYRGMIFDPETETFRSIGDIYDPDRVGTSLSMLQDARVLIAGGSVGGDFVRTAEIFDPETGLSAPTGNTTVLRRSAGAVTLSDGKVLIAGGYGPVARGSKHPVKQLRTAELFDPRTGTFTRTGDLRTPRYAMALAPLPKGEAVVAGGLFYDGYYDYGRLSAEVYRRSLPTAKVTAMRVWPKRSVVRFGKWFKIKVRLKNSGAASSRSTTICPTMYRYYFFDRLNCPTVDIPAGKAKWYVIKGVLTKPAASYADHPWLSGHTRIMEICASGQDVGTCVKPRVTAV